MLDLKWKVFSNWPEREPGRAALASRSVSGGLTCSHEIGHVPVSLNTSHE